MFEWSGVLTSGIWAAIGASGGYLWRRLRNWRKSKGQGALFYGLEGPTLFVFPARVGPDRLLPHTAIEDFLAVNNIISAYLRIGGHPPDKLRDHNHLEHSDRRNNNLILICSSKSNSVTKEAIDLLRARNSRLADLVPYFEEVPGRPGQIQIRWNKGIFPSESYEQTGPRLDDMAVIVKARNPWAEQHKILIVAGIRGIGTWGAAEMMKKWWKEIYDSKDKSRARRTEKRGDFAAIVSIHYEDHDIKPPTLCQLVDLDNAY